MTRTRTVLWMFASAGFVTTAGAGLATRLTQSALPRVTTVAVTRADVVEYVSATGSLEAVTTVNVGSQVSGTVQALLADFNDLVRKGQTLARLDPSMLEAQVEQARANVVRAEADVERLRVTLEAARLALDRTKLLAVKRLVSDMELDAASVSVRSTDAQIRSAEAAVAQARASLNQADVNLTHSVITSPIDGIVVSRAVDAGQTVAASMQAPTLFVLAADLTQMRVNASLDESDVGRVESGQPVTFRVEAYPDDTFAGRVAQVRLQPTVSQNVVTYATVIDVANPQLKLKPGMTATVSIEVARRDHVLQVPNGTLRVRPPAEVVATLGATSSGGPPETGDGRLTCTGSEGCATLWLYDGKSLRGVTVRTGISNGTVTEILSGGVTEGDPVVSAITSPTASSNVVSRTITGASSGRSPLLSGTPPGPPGGTAGPR